MAPRVTQRVYVRMCLRVCACVCKNNEIAPFLGFSLSHYVHKTYKLAHSCSFSSCGIMFIYFCAQVMWWQVKRLVARFNRYRLSSLK